jgi:hypothetical protein
VQDEHNPSEIRRLPDHPHCRGVPFADGKYAGCRYGSGDLTPLTGPCDCPVCHGSGFEGVVGTTLPHQCFGDPDCCGCLNGIIRGEIAEIICNECQVVIRAVPLAELQRTLDEMELTLDVASAQCPHCGATHLAPGFSELIAFVCEQCGETVRTEGRSEHRPVIQPTVGEYKANTCARIIGMRRCTVSMTGTDGQRHSNETDALSLFDAAFNAQQQWAKFSWFDPQAVIEIRAGKDVWRVRQDRIRVWAYGSSRRRRRQY